MNLSDLLNIQMGDVMPDGGWSDTGMSSSVKARRLERHDRH
jgi:hypothetical protein